MRTEVKQTVLARIGTAKGDISFLYKNLITGEELAVNEGQPLVAASVIKLPIMVEAFRQMTSGEARADEMFTIAREDRMPGCGVLTHLRDGAAMSLYDLVTLMIIVSDNTATNLLIRRLGMDGVNRTMRDLNLPGSALNRLLFDAEQAAKGVQNRVTARDMAVLLEGLYRGQVVSPEASRAMIEILLQQKLNGKMPFYLDGIEIAHKTGEDEGISHDVGIVYADEPFILCFLSNNADTPAFERVMQDVAGMLAGRDTFN